MSCIVVLLLRAAVVGAVYLESDLRTLCESDRPLLLTELGTRAAALLHLEEGHSAPCVLTIAVPLQHQLALRVFVNGDAKHQGPCPLSILVDDGVLLPLCASDVIPPDRMRGRQVSLLWTPPSDNASLPAWAPQLLLVSALTRGRGCLAANRVVCRSRSRYRPFCVAKELACDNYSNCPYGDDENPDMCSAAASSTPSTAPSDAGTLRSVLADYSPWGYLMLCLLVTGAVLLLCGLWECCRRRRPSSSSSSASAAPPTHLNVAGVTTPASPVAVFVVETPPPTYESLDQPPPYDVLFPAAKHHIESVA